MDKELQEILTSELTQEFVKLLGPEMQFSLEVPAGQKIKQWNVTLKPYDEITDPTQRRIRTIEPCGQSLAERAKAKGCKTFAPLQVRSEAINAETAKLLEMKEGETLICAVATGW